MSENSSGGPLSEGLTVKQIQWLCISAQFCVDAIQSALEFFDGVGRLNLEWEDFYGRGLVGAIRYQCSSLAHHTHDWGKEVHAHRWELSRPHGTATVEVFGFPVPSYHYGVSWVAGQIVKAIELPDGGPIRLWWGPEEIRADIHRAVTYRSLRVVEDVFRRRWVAPEDVKREHPGRVPLTRFDPDFARLPALLAVEADRMIDFLASRETVSRRGTAPPADGNGQTLAETPMPGLCAELGCGARAARPYCQDAHLHIAQSLDSFHFLLKDFDEDSYRSDLTREGFRRLLDDLKLAVAAFPRAERRFSKPHRSNVVQVFGFTFRSYHSGVIEILDQALWNLEAALNIGERACDGPIPFDALQGALDRMDLRAVEAALRGSDDRWFECGIPRDRTRFPLTSQDVDFARLPGLLDAEYEEVLDEMKTADSRGPTVAVDASDHGQADTPPLNPEATVDARTATGLLLLQKHPEWSDRRVEREAGFSKGGLTRKRVFRAARAFTRAPRKVPPRGTRDGETGRIEAWEDPSPDGDGDR